MPDQLNPQIPAAEVIEAFRLLYPGEFENVVTVIANAKRNALILADDESEEG